MLKENAGARTGDAQSLSLSKGSKIFLSLPIHAEKTLATSRCVVRRQ